MKKSAHLECPNLELFFLQRKANSGPETDAKRSGMTQETSDREQAYVFGQESAIPASNRTRGNEGDNGVVRKSLRWEGRKERRIDESSCRGVGIKIVFIIPAQ